jgi:ABC-type Co2+ transport system permease subunit
VGLAAVFLALVQVFKLAALVIRHLHLRHKAITAAMGITQIMFPELAVVALVR